jgi:hypothetical protein
MSCPCGHQFCWYCLKDYFHHPKNIYSVHEPKECAFIFFSKITMFFMCLCCIILTSFGNEVFQYILQLLFTGFKWFFHVLVVDIAIAINIIAVNQWYTRYNQFNYNQKGFNWMYLIGLLTFDLLALIGLCFL